MTNFKWVMPLGWVKWKPEVRPIDSNLCSFRSIRLTLSAVLGRTLLFANHEMGCFAVLCPAASVRESILLYDFLLFAHTRYHLNTSC